MAIALVNRYAGRNGVEINSSLSSFKYINNNEKSYYSPFEYNKRVIKEVLNFGGSNVPRIISDLSNRAEIIPSTLFVVFSESKNY